jgi:gas vesicle protein
MNDPATFAMTVGSPEQAGKSPDALQLQLTITDPDLITELIAYPEGRTRNEFARSALRIGILALKQAQGRLDADVIRNESDRLMSALENRLNAYQLTAAQQLANTLRDYFDPENGRFNERVKRLIEKDGELERLLRSQIGPADSELVRTLAAHMGDQSPLMRLLTPDESKGILSSLKHIVDKMLNDQRDRILREFSLDNKEGALSRLVGELSQRHGQLTEGLQGSIKEVVGEFSLDNEDSALSRLVKRVEQAQRQISGEFSLDAETSALARMKKELLAVLEAHKEASTKFQQDVVSALAAMKARKAEALRSTTHGGDFQQAAFQLIYADCQKAGDIAIDTGNTPGLIKNCKVGDCVITLSPDCIAAGAAIVVESKERAGYDLAKTLDEIDLARRNRGAGIGLFVHSRKTALQGLYPLARYGSDVVVVWDSEDEATDVFLSAGLMVAKALCTRATMQHDAQRADFESIERAIREIEKQASGLDEIHTSTHTIKNSSEKILIRVRIMQEALHQQIAILDERVTDLKAVTDVNKTAP